MPNATPIVFRTLAAALASAALVTLASAQPPTDAPQRRAGQADCLGCQSPACVQAPGFNESSADRPRASRRGINQGDRPVPLTAFIHAVRALDRQNADPALNLNEGQRAVVEVMLDEHAAEMKTWREANRNEIQDLRANTGQRRDQGAKRGRRGQHGQQGQKAQRGSRQLNDQARGPGAPDRRQGKGNNRRRALDENSRQELEALMQSRPSAEAQREQIWDILTPAQRDFVETRMENRGDRANASRQGRRLDRSDNHDRPNKLDRPRNNEDARSGNRAQRPRRLEGETSLQFQRRMLDRIEQLPEEEQNRALDRLNRSMQRMNRQSTETSDNTI